MHDVAVVGAGPVGNRVGARLAGMGYKVVVLDQKTSLAGPVCCTGIISAECVGHFGVERNVIIRDANSARVFSPYGKTLTLKRQQPQACIVDRSAFNLFFARQAQAQGVECVLGSEVTAVKVQKDRVSIESRHGGNQVEAKVLVVAAGSASKLVEGLGFGRVGDFAMGVQASVETSGVDEVEV